MSFGRLASNRAQAIALVGSVADRADGDGGLAFGVTSVSGAANAALDGNVPTVGLSTTLLQEGPKP